MDRVLDIVLQNHMNDSAFNDCSHGYPFFKNNSGMRISKTWTYQCFYTSIMSVPNLFQAENQLQS